MTEEKRRVGAPKKEETARIDVYIPVSSVNRLGGRSKVREIMRKAVEYQKEIENDEFLFANALQTAQRIYIKLLNNK